MTDGDFPTASSWRSCSEALACIQAGADRYDHPQPILSRVVKDDQRLDLERYLHYYNTERTRTGRWTNGRTPEQVLGEGQTVAQQALMRRHN